jgi:hypothetical protein
MLFLLAVAPSLRRRLPVLPAEGPVNKGVPSMFVALLTGVGLGLALSKVLKKQPNKLSKPAPRPRPPQRLPAVLTHRLAGYLDAERN